METGQNTNPIPTYQTSSEAQQYDPLLPKKDDHQRPNPPPPPPTHNRRDDVIIGINFKEEALRTDNMATMIIEDAYNTEIYGDLYFKVLRINNAIYKFTYVYFLLFLSFVVGIWCSFALALFTATIEFCNLFLVRPFLRIVGVLMELAVFVSRMISKVIQPILELVFSGTFKNKHA
jgi:hypothetical protein